jgi:hypothetical protein|tara:strand:- start:589 stop:795 length:207 start_codon:yes stop_codon:yes gene_type:complete
MDQILLVPRNDGFAVSINGKVWIKEMDAEGMLWLSLRCQKAGLEMMRQEGGKDVKIPVSDMTPDLDDA